MFPSMATPVPGKSRPAPVKMGARPKPASPKPASPKSASPKVHLRPAPVPTPKSRRRRRHRATSVNSIRSRVHDSPVTEESLAKTKNIRAHIQGRKYANLLNRTRKSYNNVRKAENNSAASIRNLVNLRRTHELKRFDVNRFTVKGETLKNRRKKDRVIFASMNSVIRPKINMKMNMKMNLNMKPSKSRKISERKAHNQLRKNPVRSSTGIISEGVFQEFIKNQPSRDNSLTKNIDENDQENIDLNDPENVDLNVHENVPLNDIDNMNKDTFQQFQIQQMKGNKSPTKRRPKPSRKRST